MENLKAVFYWRDAAANPTLSLRARNFTRVRLHHFCRPSTFNSYKRHGIRLFSHEELARFHRLFSNVSKEDRQRLIDGGKPAMIVFDAPVEELEASAAEELDLYLELLAQGAFKNFDGLNHHIDFTASFYQTVPPEWIIEYRWLDPGVRVDEFPPACYRSGWPKTISLSVASSRIVESAKLDV